MSDSGQYLLAEGAAELERLRLQARVWEPEAERMLDLIDVQAGWRCIDLGLSNRLGRPEVAPKAMCLRTLRQFGQELLFLLRIQPGRGPQAFVMVQRRNATGLGTFNDITDCTLCQTQCIRNLLLLVALLMHFPGSQAAVFSPILWCALFRGCHVTLIPRFKLPIKSLSSYQ
jgi:hypothetical protein